MDSFSPMQHDPEMGGLLEDDLRDDEDPVANEEMIKQQARFRANFRATMRAKFKPQNQYSQA